MRSRTIAVLGALALGTLLLLTGGMAEAVPIGPSPLSCPNGSCDGAIYNLTYTSLLPVAGQPLQEEVQVRIDVDTTSYAHPGAFLHDVALKVTSHDPIKATLIGAPDEMGHALALADIAAHWSSPNDGGINAGGCSGSGGGFECFAHLDPSPLAGSSVVGVKTTGSGVSHTFAFLVDLIITRGDLFVGDAAWAAGLGEKNDVPSLKARYVELEAEEHKDTRSPGCSHEHPCITHTYSLEKEGSLLSEPIVPDDDPLAPTGPASVPEPGSLVLFGAGALGLGAALGRRARA